MTTATAFTVPYLPSVSWIADVLAQPNVHWITNELNDKRKPLNRCRIASAQGAQMLSVPLVGGRNQRVEISELKIQNGKWQREHAHALQTAYGNAPYFEHYADDLLDIISQPRTLLMALNLQLVNLLLIRLHITVNQVSSPDVTITVPQRRDPIQYRQVFSDRVGFVADCSIVDLLFNHGPDARQILMDANR